MKFKALQIPAADQQGVGCIKFDEDNTCDALCTLRKLFLKMLNILYCCQ